MTNINLLCVDDDDAIRLILQKVLTLDGFNVELAANGEAALQAVEANFPHLIVLDLDMPVMSGFDVCRALKNNPFTAQIPILMLTAQSDIDFKVRGFEAGADDYLVKPFHPRELRARIEALLRMVRRESDRNPSSGLPGGRALETEMQRRHRAGERFALCYLDLDHFKPFAETFGFSAADAVIRDTGTMIIRVLREVGEPSDFAGHIGGDDFLIMTTEERAPVLIRECKKRFEELVGKIVGGPARQAGCFEAEDRDGQRRNFPLAKMTAVTVPVAADEDLSVTHLGELAAEAKRRTRRNAETTTSVSPH